MKLINSIDQILGTEVPTLLKKYPMEDDLSTHTNPFESGTNFEKCMEMLEVEEDEIGLYEREFSKLPTNEFGKVLGKDCFAPLMSTGAEKKDLQQIWNIVDSGKEGALNSHQYVLAKVLVRLHLENGSYPINLPPVE